MKEQIAESKLHALDYWQVIRNRWGVILLTFFLVLLASLVIVALLDKKYVGRTSLQVHQVSKEEVLPGAIDNVERGNSMSASFLETQFKIITSPETLLKVVQRKNLTQRWDMREADALTKLSKMIETQEERGTEIMEIQVYSTNWDEAAELANAVREAYEDRRNETEKERVGRVVTILQTKLNNQQDEVNDARTEVMRLMKLYGIIDTSLMGAGGGPSPFIGTSNNLYMLSKERELDMQTQVAKFKANLQSLSKLTGDQLIEGAMSYGVEDDTIKQFASQWKKDRIDYEKMTNSGFGRNHPKVRGLASSIAKEKSILQDAAESYKSSLVINIANIETALASVRGVTADTKTENLNEKVNSAEYSMRKQEWEQKLELLNRLRETVLKTTVSESLPREPIQVHEVAKPNNTPARPNVPLLLGIGAGLGLILGLMLAFFLEYLDTSVKTLDDVEHYLGVPVLAVIPKDVGVLHKQSGMSPDAEAYRILRTNIEFNRKSADANAITIVSGGAGEGKSTTLVNLAYICAQGGYNTLMIDGDLRRPKLHTFFDINNSVGLTNYLTTALQLEDVILQTPIENLYFMPSGILPADAAGILNSRRMSELIADVKNRFDLVLIDSPPILGVSDASVLASEVDLTMIVIQHRKLPRTMLLRVKQAIENVGGNLLGVVLNNVDVRSDSQYQYYTSYYTYYSPTNTEKARPRPAAAAPGTPVSSRSGAKSGGSPSRKGDKEDY
ncbi:MAG: polysaccharide biosynthesis tyrosine autokinase [Verrucomicrobiota bacterium]